MEIPATLRRPLRNLGWLLGGRGVNAVFSLLYLALATRHLGLEGFGQFALIVVMAQAVTGIASFSAWQAVVHWGACETSRRAAVGFAMALDLVSVGGGSLLAACVAFSAPAWLPLPLELRGFALGMCIAALVSVRSTPTGVLRLHDRYDLAASAEAVLPATRAAGAVLAAYFMPTIGGFVAAWAAAELACAAAFWTLALRLEPVRLSDISLRNPPAEKGGAWRFVWATSLSRTLGIVSRQVLLLLVGAVGGAALAGGFRVASQLGQALVQFGEALIRALYPDLVHDREKAAGLAGQMALLAAGAGLLAVAVAAVAGGWIVEVIAGPGFAFVHVAMVILAIAGSIELLAASADAFVVSHGGALSVLAIRAVPLLAALVALPFAIDGMGILGAALCILASSAASALGLGYAAFARATRR